MLQQRPIHQDYAHASVLIDYFPTFKGLNPKIELVIGTTTKEIHCYYRANDSGDIIHQRQIIEYTDSTKTTIKTIYPAETV